MPQLPAGNKLKNIETELQQGEINVYSESKIMNFNKFMKINEDVYEDVEKEIEEINSTGENPFIRIDKLKKLMKEYSDPESIEHIQRAITWLEKNPHQDRWNNNFGWD